MVIIVLVVLGLLIVLPLAIGTLLPVSHVASVSARVDAPPERVWEAITGVNDFPRWRSDVDRTEPLPGDSASGGWVEIGRTGRLPMRPDESVPGRRLVLRIVDEGLPFGGTWTYDLSPEGSGTRITVTEEGRIHNPIFRFVSRFLVGHERTLRRYLGDLTADLGGRVLP